MFRICVQWFKAERNSCKWWYTWDYYYLHNSGCFLAYLTNSISFTLENVEIIHALNKWNVVRLTKLSVSMRMTLTTLQLVPWQQYQYGNETDNSSLGMGLTTASMGMSLTTVPVWEWDWQQPVWGWDWQQYQYGNETDNSTSMGMRLTTVPVWGGDWQQYQYGNETDNSTSMGMGLTTVPVWEWDWQQYQYGNETENSVLSTSNTLLAWVSSQITSQKAQ